MELFLYYWLLKFFDNFRLNRNLFSFIYFYFATTSTESRIINTKKKDENDCAISYHCIANTISSLVSIYKQYFSTYMQLDLV